ncbi:MAG: permease-like cell division protein FtsX [Ruminococcus sp.]|nr:permease-like cell division protein FtsX [Ruminococcus sp.]
MMKKIRSFFYLLGQGFIGVFRNSIMTTASVLVLVCCMLVMGTFGLVVKVIEKNFEQVDDLNVIVAYLDKELDDTAISSLQTQIENMRNVTEVRFVSKEQALERLKEKMGEDDFLSYYGDEMNPLPDSFEIAFSDPDQAHLLLNSVEKLDGIDSTSDKISLVERVSLITGGLMIIAWIMMAVLLVVSLFVIMNTIKLGVFARKSEITIMRYVGATGAFITMPFIVEGILIGIFAAVIASGIQYYLYSYVIGDIIVSYRIGTMPPFSDYIGFIAAVFVGIGLFAGIIASSLSLKKYLKA